MPSPRLTAATIGGGDGLLLEHAVDAALVLAFLDALSLVVLLLASSDGNDQLGQSTFVDEQAQRHNRETGLQGGLGDVAYFLAVQQELTVTVGRVVVVGAVRVLGNVHVLDPDLAIDNHAIGVGQATLALTDGLDLGSGEHNASSECLDDLVIECGLAVLDIDCIMVIVVSSHCDVGMNDYLMTNSSRNALTAIGVNSSSAEEIMTNLVTLSFLTNK